MKHFKALSFAVIAAFLLAGQNSHSFDGTRGGGDICEDRIKTIRSDIHSWIQKGGAAALSLPQGTSLEIYTQKMLESISEAKIRCVGRGDKGHPVQVYGTPKVCAFNRSPFSGATITCDRENFMKMGESDQYILVHHEYAGLAGIEKPNKDDSEYGVSNQITAYLTQQTVLKLAVKTAPPKRSTGAPCDQQINYERDVAFPAIEKLLIPRIEKTLKSLYAVSGEKIKNIRTTYKWVRAKDGESKDYILVQIYVSNNANSTDVFEAEFFGRYGKGSERVFEVISKDALGRKKPPVCASGVIFDPAYKMRNFEIRNATTGTIVASMELNSAEEGFYEIAFYR